MANIEYRSDLDIFVNQPVPGKAEPKLEVQFYFVETFESGAGGKIDLKTTNDSAIAAEIDRIRTQQKVTIYLNSKITLTPTSKLIDLAKSGVKNFSVVFRVKGFDKKEKKTVSVTALMADAVFDETPIPVGGTPPALKIKLTLSNARANRYAGDELNAAARNFGRIPARAEV